MLSDDFGILFLFKFEIVEEVKPLAEATKLTPEKEAISGTKLVAKGTPGRPKRCASAKAKEKVAESPKKVEVELEKKAEIAVGKIGESADGEKVEEIFGKVYGKSTVEGAVPCDENIEEFGVNEESQLVRGKNINIWDLNEKGSSGDELDGEDVQMEQDRYGGVDELDEYGDRVDFGDHDEDLADDDVEEPTEETDALEEESKELTAIAKERKIKKEHEIFVGGLDRDAIEEDVRQVFEKIGEVVEVRLHKNPITNKNKGYAFVKFANKEHAKRALLEMKNPVVSS